MKWNFLAVITTFLAPFFFATNVMANSGQVVSHCVIIESENSQYDDTVYYNIQNACGEDIFVIYCGDVVGSSSVCGGGNNSVYYTHSKILPAGSSSKAAIRGGGDFYWGACAGRMGFGNEGHFEDYPDGSYMCLPR